MDFLLHGFNIFIFVIIGILYLFMPNLMNKYLLFGVTVNDKILSDNLINDIKKQYRIAAFITWIVTMAIYIGAVFTLDVMAATLTFTGLLIIQIMITYLIYFKAHKAIKEVKSKYGFIETTVQTIETSETKEFKVVKMMWYLLYLVTIMILVVVSINKYPELPEQIATHFDEAGVANGFSDKSYMTVLLMPITMTFLALMFIGINYTMKKAKKVSGVSREKLSFKQESKFRYLWAVAIYLMGLILIGIFTMIQLTIIGVSDYGSNLMTLILGSTGLIILLVTGLAIHTGQSGSRLKTNKKEKQVVDKEDDLYWKGGILYFNPKDPSIFVHKRFGIGMTLNYGNPIAWVVFAAIIGFIIFGLVSG